MSMPYLVKRPSSKQYYLRLPIPRDLQAHYGNKATIYHSLSTENKKCAEHRVLKCVDKAFETFKTLRKSLGKEKKRAKGRKHDDLSEIFILPDYYPESDEPPPFRPITTHRVRNIVAGYRRTHSLEGVLNAPIVAITTLPSHYNDQGEVVGLTIYSDGEMLEVVMESTEDHEPLCIATNPMVNRTSLNEIHTDTVEIEATAPVVNPELNEMFYEMSAKLDALQAQLNIQAPISEPAEDEQQLCEPEGLVVDESANTAGDEEANEFLSLAVGTEPEEMAVAPTEACVRPVTGSKSGMTLQQLFRAFLAEKEAQCRANKTQLNPKLESRYRVSFESLAGLVGEHKLISDIKRSDMRELRDLLIGMPTNLKKMPETRNLSLAQVYQGIREGQFDELTTLSITTVNQRIETLSAMFRFGVQEEFLDKNPAVTQGLALQKKLISIEERNPYPLEALLHLKACTKGTEHELIVKLGLFMGLRMNEIIQLRKEDIRQSRDGIWFVDVNNQSGKKIKTKESIRQVPIPDVLLEQGFLLFVETCLTETLFNIPVSKVTGYRSDVYSKRFRYFAQKNNLLIEHCCFHSLRHNFRDYTREAELPEPVSRRLGGWAEEGAASHYGSGHKLAMLKHSMDQIAALIVRDVFFT